MQLHDFGEFRILVKCLIKRVDSTFNMNLHFTHTDVSVCVCHSDHVYMNLAFIRSTDTAFTDGSCY